VRPMTHHSVERLNSIAFSASSIDFEYAGAIYYVMSRGNGEAAVFRNEPGTRLARAVSTTR